MKRYVSDILRLTAPIDRALYAALGLLLFAVKHNLDRFIAWKFFGQPWSVFSYLRPAVSSISGSGNGKLFATLLLISLPFALIGVWLTARRLQSARLPIWLAVLFFVPFLNLLLFATLCVVPEIGRA